MTNAESEKDNMRFITDKYQVMYSCGKKPSDIQCIEGNWPLCASKGAEDSHC